MKTCAALEGLDGAIKGLEEGVRMMNGRTRSLRTFAALALCLGPALSLFSCNLPHSNTLPPEPFTARPTGTDLAVTARFLNLSDEVPGFFRTLLADSGIVPLRIVLRNDGAGSLVIYDANGMELGAGFEGIVLTIEGRKYLPVNPKRVAELVVGVKKAARYRPVGSFQVLVGTMIAPLGGYYLYSEIDVGRFYKPLFKNSLYPARVNGMMEPIRLGPGEEKSGYLYFALSRPRGGTPCDLLVHACAPIAARDTVAGYDFRFARSEVPLEAAGDSSAHEKIPPIFCDFPYGYLFKLTKQGSLGKGSLYARGVRRLTADPDGPWMLVASILSQSAFIADASCRSSIAACAVNFMSKSKVFVVQCGSDGKVIGEKSFPRGIKRVFAAEEGLFVLTEDDFCHFLEYPSLAVSRSVRLGRDIETAFLVDKHLFVLSRGKRLDVFGAARGTLLEPLDQHALRRGDRTPIGFVDGEFFVLNKGSRSQGDTLAVFDIGERAEIRRGALPGKVEAASTDGASIIVQLEDGTLLRIVRAPLGRFKIAEAGCLPFIARTLEAAPDGFVAFDKGGACAMGAVGAYRPGRNGALEVSVKVQ